MAIDNQTWNFLFRIVRNPTRPTAPDRVVLLMVTRDEDAAFALCTSWRADEPDDDLLCIGWSAMNGHRYKGHDCTILAPSVRQGYLDALSNMLAPPMLEAINLAVRAMQGEYGENCDPIRPGFSDESENDDYV